MSDSDNDLPSIRKIIARLKQVIDLTLDDNDDSDGDNNTIEFELHSPWLSADRVRDFEATQAQIQEYKKSVARASRLLSLRKRKSSQISSSVPVLPSQPKPAKKPKATHTQVCQHGDARTPSPSLTEVEARSEMEAANSDPERESSRLPSRQVELSLLRRGTSYLVSVGLAPITLPVL